MFEPEKQLSDLIVQNYYFFLVLQIFSRVSKESNAGPHLKGERFQHLKKKWNADSIGILKFIGNA